MKYSGAAAYHGKRVDKLELLVYNYIEPNKQTKMY